MAYQGYPPTGGGGYPPQQGGYPPQQGYPQPGGGGYPPQPGGGYPPAASGYGQPSAPGYPPAPGGQAYPPQSGGYPQQGGGYPPQPSAGYPPAAAGYPGAPQSGGIGFEGVSTQPQPAGQAYGQPPAQNYGQPPAPYGGQPGYGAPPPGAQGAYPPQAGYPASAPPPASYQAPAGAPYGSAPPQMSASYGGMAGQPGIAAGMAAMSLNPKTHGTVKTHSPFHAEDDAKILRKAMKGIGTDEKAIINVIAYRTNKQRQEIKLTFKQMFGKDLIKELKSELSGNFESLVKALFMKPREYDSYLLHKAMAGLGTKESVLIEILASRSNKEITEIKEYYKKELHRNLEKDLRSETSGHFARLLVSLCTASRNENPNVDVAKARQDAQALYSAGEKKWGTDESTFNMVMCSRSYPQLRATYEEYKKIANRDLLKSISSEFSGDIKDGLMAIVEVTKYAPTYFAKVIHDSMSGVGTNDSQLIRSIVTRSEIDLVEIKQEFQKMYGKSLSSFIQGDTSGDYKKLLLALIG